MLSTIGIILLIFGFLIFSHSITTFIHELGHAIPALLFTREQVIVMVGSYGESGRGFTFKIGRLHIFFVLRVAGWNTGVCMHNSSGRVWKELIIVAGGPIASLLLGLGLIYWMKNDEFSSPMQFGLGVLLVSGLMDFLSNSIPSSSPQISYQGRTLYNDGFQFLQLLKMGGRREAYQEAMNFYYDKKYQEAAAAITQLQEEGVNNKQLFWNGVQAWIKLGKPKKALEYFETYGPNYTIKAADYIQAGDLFVRLRLWYRAKEAYDQVLYLNHEDVMTRVKRGQIYYEMQRYERAEEELSIALSMKKSLAIGYSSRALTFLATGEEIKAEEDIQQAMTLGNHDPHVLVQKGRYYFEKEEYELALADFKQAESIDSYLPHIAKYMEETEKEINRLEEEQKE